MATTLGPAVIRVKIVSDGTPSAPPTGAAAQQEERKADRAARKVKIEREEGDGFSLKRVAGQVVAVAAVALTVAEVLAPLVFSSLKELLPGMVTDALEKAAQKTADAASAMRTEITSTLPALITAGEMVKARGALGLPVDVGQSSFEFNFEREINQKLSEFEASTQRDFRNSIGAELTKQFKAKIADAVKGSMGR